MIKAIKNMKRCETLSFLNSFAQSAGTLTKSWQQIITSTHIEFFHNFKGTLDLKSFKSHERFGLY